MSLNVKKLNTDPYGYACPLEIPELVELLEQLSLAYYTATPIVSDNAFDTIKCVLEERDPDNKFFKTVGYKMTDSKSKVVLPFPLFSLDKLKIILLWLRKYGGPYMLSDKLDGISGLLYKHKEILRLFTRGDGINGQDISHLISYILKDFDFTKLPEICAIRGEIVISKENYATVKDKYLDHRSCISGLVNSKKKALLKEKDKIQLAHLTDFVGYELISPRHKLDTQFKMLEDWGFPLVEYELRNEITNETLSEYLTERRTKSKYYIDGIVVGDCSKSYPLSPDSNPDYAFAFKLVFGDQIFETTAKRIEWDVSKHGYIKPVVILEPVVINGITVTRVTGNNAQYIVKHKIGSGTVLKIIRSGDVIPKIVSVVSGQVDVPQMPAIKYKWNETGIDLIATETTQITKNIMTTKKITFFFTSMGVKFMGEGIVKKLVDNGYDSIVSILKADLKHLSKINGLGANVLSKIYESIRVSFETADLATLMSASGIFGRNMGKKKIEIIVKAIPTIINETPNDNLAKIINNLDGFSDTTTQRFIGGLNNFKEFFEALQRIDTISVGHMLNVNKIDDIKVEGIFKDMKFVFTGPRNKEIINFVEKNGGIASDRVNKSTNMLLYESDKDKGSSKYVDAIKFGTTIMTNKDFSNKYMATQ